MVYWLEVGEMATPGSCRLPPPDRSCPTILEEIDMDEVNSKKPVSCKREFKQEKLLTVVFAKRNNSQVTV